jgi:AraC-like DNA-binding protein
MSYILLLLTALSSLNTDFTIKKIYDDRIYYNFVTYENELFISSSEGIYKINESAEDLTIYDKSITGAINTIFQKNNNFVVKFTKEIPIVYPKLYSESINDFAFLDNTLLVIARGKLLVYSNLMYSFKAIGSVRSISNNGVGSYAGVYINGNRLKKITYTDGQIKEFDSITFVCYNGLLSIKDNIETKIYNNDNSIRTKGEYGAISNIYDIGNYKYLAISDKGIYKYNYKTNTFNLIYTNQYKIIPVRNKIDSRIKDRGEFHFIDNKRYISLNVNNNNLEIIDDDIKYEINDILESDINGNDFYAISKNNLLISFKRTKQGLKLSKETPLNSTAHTISDYNNLIFLSGNNGLSVFEKNKEKIIDNYIVDEFNRAAVYKQKNKISFGSIHGVYSIDNVLDFERNLIFKDYKISSQKPYLYFVGLILLFVLLIIIKKLNKKHVTDDQLISNIKKYINKNLNIATLKMLESEFNLDYNDINSINKNFKPAKYIKKQRLELTKKMLLNSNSISAISKRTGYSETYLLKNKYKFINK